MTIVMMTDEAEAPSKTGSEKKREAFVCFVGRRRCGCGSLFVLDTVRHPTILAAAAAASVWSLPEGAMWTEQALHLKLQSHCEGARVARDEAALTNPNKNRSAFCCSAVALDADDGEGGLCCVSSTSGRVWRAAFWRVEAFADRAHANAQRKLWRGTIAAAAAREAPSRPKEVEKGRAWSLGCLTREEFQVAMPWRSGRVHYEPNEALIGPDPAVAARLRV